MNLLNTFIEVTFDDSDNFLKIKETLSRIGIASRKDNILYQSCHILHKSGKYYIVHFKELFELDGKQSSLTQEDIERRNTIADLLSEWKLCKIVNPDICLIKASMSSIKILSHAEKSKWQCIQKYDIGVKKI